MGSKIEDSTMLEPLGETVARISCIHHDGVGDTAVREAVAEMTSTGHPLCEPCVNGVLRLERGLRDDQPTDEPVSREGEKIGPPHVTAVERARDAAQQFGDDDESNVEARLLSDVLHFLQAWTDPDRPTHADARSDQQQEEMMEGEVNEKFPLVFKVNVYDGDGVEWNEPDEFAVTIHAPEPDKGRKRRAAKAVVEDLTQRYDLSDRHEDEGERDG